MELNEAIEKAERGDVGAMCALGDYYYEKKEWDESKKWFNMAGDNNSLYGIVQSVSIGLVLSYAGMHAAEAGLEFGIIFAEDEWENTYKWAKKEKECIINKIPGSEVIDKPETYMRHSEIEYHLALCKYWNDKFFEVIPLVSEKEDTRFKILLAATIPHIAETESDYEKMDRLSKEIIADSNYAISSRTEFEEAPYSIIWDMVSLDYKSLDKFEEAVEILNKGISVMKHEHGKKLLSDELSHYKKKMFGGYKYV